MTDEQLAAIKARVEAATPGPWVVDGEPDPHRAHGYRVDGIRSSAIDWGDDDGPDIVIADSGVYPPRKPDAEFIAEARTDMPALLAEIDRLKAALKLAVDFLGWDFERGKPYGVMTKTLTAEQMDAPVVEIHVSDEKASHD